MAEYYYLDGDGQSVCGPFSVQDVLALREKGLVEAQTLVCLGGQEEWLPLAAHAKLMPDLSPPSPQEHQLAHSTHKWFAPAAAIIVLLILVGLIVTRQPNAVLVVSAAQVQRTAAPPMATPMSTPTPVPVSVAELEDGYAAAAAKLATEIRTALGEETTQTRLLGRAREWEGKEKRIQTIFAKRYGAKFAPSAQEDLIGVRLARLTDRPPLLTEDASDLYHRYKSVLKFQANLETQDEKSGGEQDMFCFQIEIPVGADRLGRWVFPSLENALQAIDEKCDEPKNFYVDELDRYLKMLTPEDER